jgi:hypothetical protein
MDLFGSSCHALLAQKVDGALQVSVGLHTMHRQTQARAVSLKCRQIFAPRMRTQIGVFAKAGTHESPKRGSASAAKMRRGKPKVRGRVHMRNLLKRALAVHHGRSSFVAQFLHRLCRYVGLREAARLSACST